MAVDRMISMTSAKQGTDASLWEPLPAAISLQDYGELLGLDEYLRTTLPRLGWTHVLNPVVTPHELLHYRFLPEKDVRPCRRLLNGAGRICWWRCQGPQSGRKRIRPHHLLGLLSRALGYVRRPNLQRTTNSLPGTSLKHNSWRPSTSMLPTHSCPWLTQLDLDSHCQPE